MRTWNLLLLSISALLIVHGFCSVYHSTETSKEDVDLDAEELSFLEEDDIETPVGKGSHSEQLPYEEDDESENFDDFEEGSGDHDAFSHSVIDEKDVVVLTDSNFSDFIEKNQYVMVEFYAPWCGHCQTLAPEYAAAATELKSEAFLAKVDATEENDLAQKYNIQGFPTVLFFIDGVHKPYQGQRLKDAIVTWIKKKTGPGVYNITTVEDAKKILSSENKLVLGFLESLVGPESQELAAASKLEDDVNFYQTSSGDVAEIFHLNSESKRPSLVLIKNEEEKISLFDGQFTKSTIVEFVFANKLPLVITFSRDTAPLIFESSIRRQVLLFASSSDSKKLLPNFLEAAKLFKGKLIFLYVDMDNADVGKPVADYFGVTGDGPIVLAYEGNENAKKFILDGEITIDNVKTFGEGFLEDKLEPFYKSEPIPKSNDGDVRIVVGKSFDEIVLDESKDVLLEIYAPWCGHCQALEPIYKKLAKHLHGIESLVIAKMDATTNEHPRAKSDGFPTILFFPAGNKSFDPIVFDGDRTVVEMYKFIKKHASTPFKLQKPTSTLKKPEATLTIELPKSSSSEVRDEL